MNKEASQTCQLKVTEMCNQILQHTKRRLIIPNYKILNVTLGVIFLQRLKKTQIPSTHTEMRMKNTRNLSQNERKKEGGRKDHTNPCIQEIIRKNFQTWHRPWWAHSPSLLPSLKETLTKTIVIKSIPPPKTKKSKRKTNS